MIDSIKKFLFRKKMLMHIPRNWNKALDHRIGRDEWRKIIDELASFLQTEDGYHPQGKKIFAALKTTPFHKVRVVIIGQNPYSDGNDASGIAFFAYGRSTPSLINIYKAIRGDDVEDGNLINGCLKRWAEQEGVLLLNRVLTFCEDEENEDVKNKHDCKEWRAFTQAVVQALAKSNRPIQFMLWGNEAQTLRLTNYPECLIHKTRIPAQQRQDYVADFLDCQHFSKVNDILVAMGDKPIDWIKDPNP